MKLPNEPGKSLIYPIGVMEHLKSVKLEFSMCLLMGFPSALGLRVFIWQDFISALTDPSYFKTAIDMRKGQINICPDHPTQNSAIK